MLVGIIPSREGVLGDQHLELSPPVWTMSQHLLTGGNASSGDYDR